MVHYFTMYRTKINHNHIIEKYYGPSQLFLPQNWNKTMTEYLKEIKYNKK